MMAAVALSPETIFASFSTLSTTPISDRIVGGVGHERQGNSEKKGKFAQTDMRSGHQALR